MPPRVGSCMYRQGCRHMLRPYSESGVCLLGLAYAYDDQQGQFGGRKMSHPCSWSIWS